MKSLFFTALSLISLNLCAQGSFQDQTVVNGVFYIATENTIDHATYIQQDNFDFPLAADSFYVLLSENKMQPGTMVCIKLMTDAKYLFTTLISTIEF